MRGWEPAEGHGSRTALTWDRQVTLSTATPGEAMTLMKRKKEESSACPHSHLSSFPPFSLVRGRGFTCWGVWTRGRKDVAAGALPSPHPGARLPWSHPFPIPFHPNGVRGPRGGHGLPFSTLEVIPATAAPEAAPQPVTDPHSQPLCLPSSWVRAGLITEGLQMPMALKNTIVAAFQGQAGLAGTPFSRRLLS